MIDIDRLFPASDAVPGNAEQSAERKVSSVSSPVQSRPDTPLTSENKQPREFPDNVQPVQRYPVQKQGMGCEASDEQAIADRPRPRVRAPADDIRAASSGTGSSCAGCAHIDMQTQMVPGSRRRFWWCCSKGHAMLEVWGGPRHELIAPETCCDYAQWSAPTRRQPAP